MGEKTRKPIKLLQMNMGKKRKAEKGKEKVKRDRWKSSWWRILPGQDRGIETSLPWKTTKLTHLSPRIYWQLLCGRPVSGAGKASVNPDWDVEPGQRSQLSTQINAHLRTVVGAEKETPTKYHERIQLVHLIYMTRSWKSSLRR